MAYSELVKNFSRIREYMREFYVYGFKGREEYTAKSARSYDDERRRMESYLGDSMRFTQTPAGKRVFISIDSRTVRHNPLYAAWKAKSFTDGDITLHFLLFDILDTPATALPLADITAALDDRLAVFPSPRLFDASTVRKKLGEYVSEGLIETEKRGKTLYYRRAADAPILDAAVLDFFSEVAPCGVIGSYLLDKTAPHTDLFTFKHHYITGTTDSEILYALFGAMRAQRFVTLQVVNRRRGGTFSEHVVPLRIFISVQSGRQYLLAYAERTGRITSFRTDNIAAVEAGEVCGRFAVLRQKLDGMRPHMWGVSTQGGARHRTEHVEFTVRYGDDEAHIHRRLEREKRCGSVERLDAHTSRFSAELFDSTEILPWMRTFLCRIVSYRFSNETVGRQFGRDIEAMYRMYGIADAEGGGGSDLQ